MGNGLLVSRSRMNQGVTWGGKVGVGQGTVRMLVEVVVLCHRGSEQY